MPTINDEKLAREIIAANGYYLDDPQVVQVAKYTNDWGGTSYHLAYNDGHIFSLLSSPHCHNIEVLWEAECHS